MPWATVRVILKPSWLGNAGERNAIVPRIFGLMYEFDHGIGCIRADHLDELLLLEILIGRANIETQSQRLSRPAN